MIKVIFGKTTKTDVVLKYKKITEKIYVYKLKYTVKGNKVNTYGLCFEEDLSGLEENLLIPKRLSQYKVYHKEFLKELRTCGFIVPSLHEISLECFFNKDTSFIPSGEDCVILRKITPNIPNTILSSYDPNFFYEYNSNYPVPRLTHIGHLNEKQQIKPFVSEDKYDLEICYKQLKKRKDIDFGVGKAIQPVEDAFLFIDLFEEMAKESEDVGKLNYLDFFWQPTKEDWENYFYQLENYGIDVAKNFLIDKILKLKRND